MDRISTWGAACCLTLNFALGAAFAQTAATQFLGRGYADCDAFFAAVARTQFDAAPDLFLCHKYEYKPLYIYGYIRIDRRTRFTMTLVKGRREVCKGTGEIGWRQGNSEASASGRFECADGAKGGYAFELDTIAVGSDRVLAGTIFGGVDDNGSGRTDEVISADFYVLSKPAIVSILDQR